MTQEKGLAVRQAVPAEVVEKALTDGDLTGMSSAQRVSYYNGVCESLGLNPLTKPFDFIKLNGRLVLYAKRDATDQLRSINKVTVTITSREDRDGVFVVTARATLPDGRTDESIGAVSVDGLRGESLANAWMKAETKAKRRVTLSIVGLGWLDETEVGSVPDVQLVRMDTTTGEVLDNAPAVPEELRPVNDAQRRRIWGKLRERDITEEALRAFVEKEFQKDSTKWLTQAEYEKVDAWINTHPMPSGETKAVPADQLPLGR